MITIATVGSTSRAFSADTGMAEVLLIATRRSSDRLSDVDALWVNLSRRPSSAAEAVEIARAISGAPGDDSGWLQVGEDKLGCFIRAPLGESGCAQIVEPDVASTALALGRSTLRLPWMDSLDLPITKLGDLGSAGLVDRDINGKNSDGTPRGPFDIRPLYVGQAASYPVLWRHSHHRERRLIVKPDSQGRVRPGFRDRALKVWKTATRLHFNRDFQINSQPLAACLTPDLAIGGRAWPNYQLQDESWDKVMVLWANTTPGLIGFWWRGTRQHQGRASLTITRLGELSVIDPRQLSDAQIKHAQDLFDDFGDRPFLPANEAYRDATRIALDEAVLVDLLDLPKQVLEPLDVLRRQWCAEPTVHGGKGTRPGGSQ